VTAPWSLLLAFQQAQPASRGPGGGFFLVQMALIFAIIYFLMIRPKVKQEREHRERVSQLQKGDEVVTAGGIIGEVIHLRDDRVTVKSGESRFVVLRDRIASIPSKEPKRQERRA
jgi:preprotein translocase subunit YajC